MPFLREVFVYLAAAVVAVPIASRLGLGSVLGYLSAGVVIGPHVMALTGEAEPVLRAAELGVVLLLFLIGLELEPKRLLQLRVPVFGLGALQVGGTTALLALAAMGFGLPWRAAIIAGFGLSLSSTAFVLQLLSERNERTTPAGQASFGILLFQDLAVIPMLAVLPALVMPGAATALQAPPLWRTALVAAAVIAAVVAVSRLLVRPALRVVAQLHNPELFTVTALLLVVGTAWAVSAAGLSMALGSFLAGVLLAGSAYRHELEADIAPFKGILLGLFFMAVGSGANVSLVLQRPLLVGGLVLGLVATKAVVAATIGRFALGSAEPGLTLGILLAQGGEFAFVLFGMAAGQGILDRATADALVMAVTVSMATTPALFALHTRFSRPALRRVPARPYDAVEPEGEPPVIIAGFGRVGQVVGRVLRAKHIAFTAMDASSEHIEFIRRFGNRVFFGDASRLDLLRAARADRARVFVLAIDDVHASVRTAEVVLEHFPHLVIFARARNRQHAYRLRALGITHIMRETWLSSLEMTADVLVALGLDDEEARRTLERFRAHDENLFEQTWKDRGDEDKLAAAANRGRQELERLFEEDAKVRRSA